MPSILEAIREIKHVQVTYEDCKGGSQYENVFVVTDEAYADKTDGGFIGCTLDIDGHASFSSYIVFVPDGALYTRRIERFEVEIKIGKAKFEAYERKMRAIEELLNADIDLEMAESTEEDNIPEGEA